MDITLKNVIAKYPKMNRPYRFDQGENRSVPCGPLEDGAEYSLNFEMNDEQFAELEGSVKRVWKAFAQLEGIKSAPEHKPWNQNKETGAMIGKSKQKAAYSGEATKPPRQYDAQAKLLPTDFEITDGSIVNLQVRAIGYKGMGGGVSLRLKAVQVVTLAEAGEGSNPFEAVDGFSAEFAPVEAPAQAAPSADQFAAMAEKEKARQAAQLAQANKAAAPIEDDDIPF